MIDHISLTNFKLFKEKTEFDGLKKINLLTGVNGRGKSSFLQSMLLIKQSLDMASGVDKLFLNGDYVKLGNALDVKNSELSRDDNLILSFTSGPQTTVLSYDVDENDNQILKLLKSADEGSIKTILNRVQYVSAERIGPRLLYEKRSSGFEVGPKGEYAVDVLAKATIEAKTVSEEFTERVARLFAIETEDVDRGVSEQVEFWMSKMFGETLVDVKPLDDANIDVMKFSVYNAKDSKPTNVGFGFSYAFPILVAGLTASEKDILIIENPEAHLHPSAQSIIAKFLAMVATQGVQIFVESHSEHILNALRVLVKQEYISSKDINVMFFDESYDRHYKSLEINSKGKMPEWPDGFFDQADKDLNILLDL